MLACQSFAATNQLKPCVSAVLEPELLQFAKVNMAAFSDGSAAEPPEAIRFVSPIALEATSASTAADYANACSTS